MSDEGREKNNHSSLMPQASSLTIATWNVNSVKARLSHLLEWLKRTQPDIVLLQELKCIEEAFPCLEIEELGYNLAIHGEKTYNGVAILSKFKLEDIQKGLPGNEDDPRARYIEAAISIGVRHEALGLSESPMPNAQGLMPSVLRVASVYVPNGQTATSEKFPYKLKFLDRLGAHFKTLLSYGEMLVVGGDYNIAPTDIDVYNPQAWEGSVLTHDEVRVRFRRFLNLGMYDAQSLVVSRQSLANDSRLTTNYYTWWDYRANGFVRDDGLRIDHFLVSAVAADKIIGCEVHRDMRALEKASDHAPVVARFGIGH
jgi:exodeoxyribonuclease-3